MSKRERSPENPFLVQMLFRYTGGTGNSCQAFPHKEFAPAVWEVYLYQTAEQALDVVQQGAEQEQLHQMMWDEACREQDTLGVRVHHTMYLCEECACQAITNHAGEVEGSSLEAANNLIDVGVDVKIECSNKIKTKKLGNTEVRGARPAGLEPAANCLEGSCSIH